MPAPNRIAEKRKALGWSQPDLAERVGAHWVTVSKLERGKMELTEEWLNRFGHAMNVPPAELLPAQAHIGEARIIGDIGDAAAVHLWAPDQAVALEVFSPFFSNPNSFWLRVDSKIFEPYFPVNTVIKCEWLREEQYSSAAGRICFLQTEEMSGTIGFLQPSPQKDIRGRTLLFTVTWPGRPAMPETRPWNVALVTAIVCPDLEPDIADQSAKT